MRKLILLATALLCLFGSSRADDELQSIPIVLKKEGNRIVYELQNKEVELASILDDLTELHLNHGRETPVLVLAEHRVPLSNITTVRGIVQKVGFSKIRYFSFSEEQQMMSEFTFKGPAIPFSLNPR